LPWCSICCGEKFEKHVLRSVVPVSKAAEKLEVIYAPLGLLRVL
jgi:hypothetical protein